MNILLIGAGGREHAFARSLSLSKQCDQLFIAPGNPGTAMHGTNVDILPNDFISIKALVIKENIGLVVVGPEEPLVLGIVDFFKNDEDLKTIHIIGPGKDGAQLEGSKDFSKAFMERHQIPTAAYKSFTLAKLDEAYQYIENMQAPFVLKADGLAAGKGVLIIDEINEAKKELKKILAEDKFGKAGNKVVIESFLKGIELSVFVLTDGKNYKILPEAKDYKRIGENDTGLNTGGMGAISPVPFADITFMNKVEERIIKPTIAGLKAENIFYCGFIFIGLMKVDDDPFVIEYNCRMGDPETEAVLPRINTDFVELMSAAANGTLNDVTLEIKKEIAATVVMVSGGYPGNYEKGIRITGLEKNDESIVFHAGTMETNANVLTNGGRVLAITSLADTLNEALAKSYRTAHHINFDYAYYRKDIGKDLLSEQVAS
jgi:phosphoribosylamine--glycine ligase